MDWILVVLAFAVPVVLGGGYAAGRWVGYALGLHDGKLSEADRWRGKTQKLDDQLREYRLMRPPPPNGWYRNSPPPRPRQLEHRRNQVDGQFETHPGRPSPVPSAATIKPVDTAGPRTDPFAKITAQMLADSELWMRRNIPGYTPRDGAA